MSSEKRGRPKTQMIRKIYCNVIEAVCYEDRCLFRLSKIIEGNRVCEECILREFEKKKSGKAGRSGANDIKDIKVIKEINGINKRRRRTKPTPKRKPGPIADAPQDAEQPYMVQTLSKLLGKSERRIQEFAKEGKIPAQKVGRVWKFPREEIDRWLSGKKMY